MRPDAIELGTRDTPYCFASNSAGSFVQGAKFRRGSRSTCSTSTMSPGSQSRGSRDNLDRAGVPFGENGFAITPWAPAWSTGSLPRGVLDIDLQRFGPACRRKRSLGFPVAPDGDHLVISHPKSPPPTSATTGRMSAPVSVRISAIVLFRSAAFRPLMTTRHPAGASTMARSPQAVARRAHESRYDLCLLKKRCRETKARFHLKHASPRSFVTSSSLSRIRVRFQEQRFRLRTTRRGGAAAADLR